MSETEAGWESPLVSGVGSAPTGTGTGATEAGREVSRGVGADVLGSDSSVVGLRR